LISTSIGFVVLSLSFIKQAWLQRQKDKSGTNFQDSVSRVKKINVSAGLG